MSAKRTSNRREFLSGRAAVDALADLADRIGAADAPLDPSGASSPHYLIRLGRRAMACQFELFLNAGQYAHGMEAGVAALDLVEAIEAQLTVFRESSDVSDLNRRAGREPVAIAAPLFELLSLCERLHRATHGAFDVTAGPLSSVWGFTARSGAVPAPAMLAQALAAVGGADVLLDKNHRTVAFGRPGMAINFGAIGKGFALDRCGEWLANAGMEHFLWHGGSSSVLARGARGDENGWTVGLMHPLRPGKMLARVHLKNAAMGTSGASWQFFKHEGKRYGHIIDPRTGWPASGVFSSTVVAPSAALADALSTAFYILGPEAARDCCDGFENVGYVMVMPNESGSAVEIVTHGLPPETCQIIDQNQE